MSIQPTAGRQLSLFEKAIAGAAVVETVFTQKSVVQKDTKQAFVGVPFIITKVTFQLPDEEMTKDNDVKDYVSLECQIAPQQFIEQNAQSNWIPNIANYDGWVQQYGYRADEWVVLNDGSKGIRRQIVAALQASGMIDIGPLTGSPDDYDRPWDDWYRFDQREAHKLDGVLVDVPSFNVGSHGDPLAMPVLRGLRKSKADDAPAAYSPTYYLS